MNRYSEKELMNMRLVRAIYKSMKSLRKKESELINTTEVTFAQFEILVVVHHFGPLTVNQVIDQTLSSIGNISYVISNLVKEGYLESEKDVRDKRSKFIKMSEKGKRFMENFFPSHLENLEDIFSVYTESEKETLLKLLHKLYK